MVRQSKRILFPVRNGFYCGVDEVGRGAIAGPVVSAAVILPRGYYPVGLDDSKKLSKSNREDLYASMQEKVQFGIGLATSKEVDRVNVHHASLLAMRRALVNLRISPEIVLIDGKYVPKNIDAFTQSVVSGDSLIPAIAASSIFAKVYRDNLMRNLSRVHTEYGWENNVGYGTKYHLEGLKKHGLTSEHRCSFAPIYNMLC